MKIGIWYDMYSSIYSCYGDEKYHKIKSFGFDCVDFNLADTSSPLYTMPESLACELLSKEKSLAHNAGIAIWQVHGPWCWPPPETTKHGMEMRMEQMKRSIRLTSGLGCGNWVIHPIMPYMAEEANTGTADLTWQSNLDFMRELLAYAKKYGVTICIENMPMPLFSMSQPAKILSLAEEIDDENFKICLDTGHVAVFENMSLSDEAKRLGAQIKVLHVHDNAVGPDIHLMPFEGRIDWHAFARSLRDIGFDGVFSLEIVVSPKLPVDIREDIFRLLAKTANYILKEEDNNGKRTH